METAGKVRGDYSDFGWVMSASEQKGRRETCYSGTGAEDISKAGKERNDLPDDYNVILLLRHILL